MTFVDWTVVALVAAPFFVTLLLLLALSLRDVVEAMRLAPRGYWPGRLAGASGLVTLALFSLASSG